MKCPFRLETKKYLDGSTREYFMDCDGPACPFYVPERHYNGSIMTPPSCNRADTDFYIATHQGGKK